MRTLIFGAVCALFPASAFAQAQNTQFWGTAGVTVPIAGRLSGGFDLSLRTGDNNPRLSTTFIRPSLGYRISKALSARIGYVRIVVHPSGTAAVQENRIYQEVTWNVGKALGGNLALRSQIEERMVEGRRDTGLRVRERVRYARVLTEKGLSLVLSSEWLFALNSTDYGARAGFDQTRNFLGINVALDKYASIEAGYMNRYALRRGAPDRDDHIFPVTLAYRF